MRTTVRYMFFIQLDPEYSMLLGRLYLPDARSADRIVSAIQEGVLEKIYWEKVSAKDAPPEESFERIPGEYLVSPNSNSRQKRKFRYWNRLNALKRDFLAKCSE